MGLEPSPTYVDVASTCLCNTWHRSNSCCSYCCGCQVLRHGMKKSLLCALVMSRIYSVQALIYAGINETAGHEDWLNTCRASNTHSHLRQETLYPTDLSVNKEIRQRFSQYAKNFWGLVPYAARGMCGIAVRVSANSFESCICSLQWTKQQNAFNSMFFFNYFFLYSMPLGESRYAEM